MGLLTQAGKAIADALVGGATYNRFNNANTYLAVGDSSAAFSLAQTDIQAATNKLWVGMDATYPTVSTNVITARATFGTAQGNYAWNEVGLYNGNTATAGAVLALSRLVSSLGTKTNAATWQLTYQLTFNIS